MHHLLRHPVFFPFALLLMDSSESSVRGDLEAGGRGDGPFVVVFLSVATIALALLAYDLFVRPACLGRFLSGRDTTGRGPG